MEMIIVNMYVFIIAYIFFTTLITYLNRKVCFKFRGKKIGCLAERKDFSNNIFFLFSNAIVLIVITGLRHNMGTDYVNYEYNYKYLISDEGFGDILIQKEAIFGIINKIVGIVSDYNVVCLMTVLAITTVVLLFKGCQENASICWLYIFLLVTFGSYYSCFNTTRSYLAASIFFYCCKYIYEEKFWHYFIGVMIVTGIHFSGIVLLPLYWLLKIQWNTKKKIIIAFLAIGIVAIAFIRFEALIDIVTQYIYSDYDNGAEGVTTSFVSILRPTMFLIIISIFINGFDFQDIRNRVWFNSVVYLFIMQLFSFKFALVYRFTYFFIPLSLCALCHVISKIKNSNFKRFVIFILIILVLIYSMAGQFDRPYGFYWETVDNYF